MQERSSIRNLATYMQASKAQNAKVVPGTGSTPELKKSSSFDKSWEETVAESVADELVLQSLASNKISPFDSTEQQDEASKSKSKDPKGVKAGQSSIEEKKVAKPQKIMEFHNIKVSQVVTSLVVVTCYYLLVVLLFACVEIMPISRNSCLFSCRWNCVLRMKGKDLL